MVINPNLNSKLGYNICTQSFSLHILVQCYYTIANFQVGLCKMHAMITNYISRNKPSMPIYSNLALCKNLCAWISILYSKFLRYLKFMMFSHFGRTVKYSRRTLKITNNACQTTPSIEIWHENLIHFGWGTKPMCQISLVRRYLESMNFPK